MRTASEVDVSKKHLTEGDLFVIRQGQIFNVKRVQLLPDGGIRLVCDNQNYRPVDLNKSSIEQLDVIGKLVSAISHYD